MIIGIGLQKSGTSSLHSAMEMLNFRSLHFPAKLLSAAYSDKGSDKECRLSTASLDFSVVAGFDAICDVPVCIPEVMRQLDEHFPGSRFIYTYRDPEAWARSAIKHHSHDRFEALKAKRSQDFSRYDPTTDMYETCDPIGLFEFMYKIPIESPGRAQALRDYCIAHREQAARYFKDRPDDILFLDVSAPGAMQSLCDFLGVEAPFPDFPHKNSSTWNPKLINRLMKPYRTLVPSGVRFALRRRKNTLLEKYRQFARSRAPAPKTR